MTSFFLSFFLFFFFNFIDIEIYHVQLINSRVLVVGCVVFSVIETSWEKGPIDREETSDSKKQNQADSNRFQKRSLPETIAHDLEKTNELKKVAHKQRHAETYTCKNIFLSRPA